MLIIAHRGASGEYPENTLIAFEQAIEQGADAIELDVFQAGQELLIYHDRYLSKLGFPDVNMEDVTSDFLETLPKDRQIPRLLDALRCIDGRCQVNIEIKQLHDIHLLESIILNACNTSRCSLDGLFISAFNHPLLVRISDVIPTVRIGVIYASIPLRLEETIDVLNPYSFHMDIDCLDQQTVEEIKKLGCLVFVYTVDKETDIALLESWGVSGIFTNFPKRSRLCLRKK